jgi:hypothetical protein
MADFATRQRWDIPRDGRFGLLRRGRRFRHGRRLRRCDHFVTAAARYLQADELGANREDTANLAREGNNGAGDRRRDLYCRLVGHDGGKDLVLQDRLSDRNMPFDDFRLGHAFADIGQLDDARAHLRPPSRP